MEQTNFYHDSIYTDLNLPRLKSYAKNWGKEYPCISRITLYLAAPESDNEYFFVINAPDPTSKKLPKDEDKNEWTDEDKMNSQISKYYRWAQNLFTYCRDGIEKIHKKGPAQAIQEDFASKWSWCPLALNDSAEDFNDAMGCDLILIDTEYVLYDKGLEEQKKPSTNATTPVSEQDLSGVLYVTLPRILGIVRHRFVVFVPKTL